MTNQEIYLASTTTLKDRLSYLPLSSIRTNRFVAYERKVITVELAYREARTFDTLLDEIVYSGFGDFADEPSEYERLDR